MRRASTVQNLLIAILLAAHAGTAYAAEGPFIPIDLGTLAGTESEASGVNDSGQVVASSSTGDSAALHPFSWTQAGGMIDLGTLFGAFSFAVAVTACAQVLDSN